MILEARKIDIGTRDVAPQPGESVLLQRLTDAEVQVIRVFAHWPALGMWEVAVKGVRKAEIIVTVQPSRVGHRWWEVSGR